MTSSRSWGRRALSAAATAAVADPCAAKAVFIGVRGTGAPAGSATTANGNA